MTFCYIYKQRFYRFQVDKSIKKLNIKVCFVENNKRFVKLVSFNIMFYFYGITEHFANNRLLCKINCR